jgi:SNF2 family DNA or RNA helicase
MTSTVEERIHELQTLKLNLDASVSKAQNEGEYESNEGNCDSDMSFMALIRDSLIDKVI